MKQYGIRITLPPGDFLSAPHLLGKNWEGYRWFDTPEARDKACREMLEIPPNYRRHEAPFQILDKVERDIEGW